MATHSRILAWKIPWTEEPGGLQSKGHKRVRHNWVTEQSLATVVAKNLSLHIERVQHISNISLKAEATGFLLICLCLSFLIWNVRIVIVPTSRTVVRKLIGTYKNLARHRWVLNKYQLLSLHFIIIFVILLFTTHPSSYTTLYKTICIHLYLCISMRITLTVNRHGNIKTVWPNWTSSPVTVKVWHGKGFFFFIFFWGGAGSSFFFFFLTQHLGQPGNNHHSLPLPFHPMLPHIPVQLSSENIFQACEAHFMPTKDSKLPADFEFFLISIP